MFCWKAAGITRMSSSLSRWCYEFLYYSLFLYVGRARWTCQRTSFMLPSDMLNWNHTELLDSPPAIQS